jgi:hypothetical protein
MDAAVLHALGKPPRCEQFPEPIAGDDEVIVHVHAASLKLLRDDSQERLANALFAASRQSDVEPHFNKGLAGAPPEAIEAAKETAMNPDCPKRICACDCCKRTRASIPRGSQP